MNFIRYYLALCILVTHFSILVDKDIFTLPRIFGGAGSFFAISGFLLFPSYEKFRNPADYLRRRARRIFPPYFLIVLLCAFLLVFVSSQSASAYFSDKGFWAYLAANLSFLNFLHPTLPGVFADNTVPAVDGSLWTMKCEVLCYLLVPVAYKIIDKRKYSATGVILSFIGIFLALYIAALVTQEIVMRDLDAIVRLFRVTVIFFLGALINLKLKWFYNHRYAIITINLSLMLMNYFGIIDIIPWIRWTYEFFIMHLITATMVIACCLTGKWGHFLARHETVSYDIYLFHWPIIQVFISTGLLDRLGVYPTLGCVIAITFLLALTSWHFIGKPILKGGK